MRLQWKKILPLVGLLLFAAETYYSLRFNREIQHTPRRYFYWSSIRLDSDPLNERRRVSATKQCKQGTENCTSWEDLQTLWIDPPWLAMWLEYSALPAFLLSAFVTSGLGRLGISQVWTFLLFTPVFVFAWYYLVGWLIDGWSHNRLDKP